MKVPFFRTLSRAEGYVFDRLMEGKFQSGLNLAVELEVSRTAIWKIIQKLKQAGLNIETHRRKGYRLHLPRPLELLSEERILAALPTTIREEIEIFIYDFCPLAEWGKAFFTHQRPLTDFSVCLLETQGKPISQRGEYLHIAIAQSQQVMQWDIPTANLTDRNPLAAEVIQRTFNKRGTLNHTL